MKATIKNVGKSLVPIPGAGNLAPGDEQEIPVAFLRLPVIAAALDDKKLLRTDES